MTAPENDRPTPRWISKHSSPSIDLHQRKPWDLITSADQTESLQAIGEQAAQSLEVAVAGADFPLGRFTLPDESPVYLPLHYEPNYAYPLVVWLSDSEWTSRELLDLMPRISPQNYVGLSIEGLTATNRFARGPMSLAESLDPLESLLETLKDIACQMRREYHVHSERIFLAGFGEQASVALQMLIRRPEWFAGVLGFGLRKTKLESVRKNYDDLRGKRVFLSAGIRDSHVNLTELTSLGRLLRSTGMQPVLRSYDSGEEPSPKLLRDVDHWLMNCVFESTLV